MGLFSSKTVINTGAAISPLLQDKPNLTRNAILKATFNDLPFVPTIVDTLLAGYNIDPRAYYRFGANEDRYTLGLPNGFTPNINVKEARAKQIIADNHGVAPSRILWSKLVFAEPSPVEIGNYLVRNKYPWDDAWGYVTGGIAGMASDEVAQIFQADLRIGGDYSYTNPLTGGQGYISSPSYLDVTFKIFKRGDTGNYRTVEEVFELNEDSDPLINNWDNLMYVAEYRIPLSATNYSYPYNWLYDLSSEVYPELDVYDEPDEQSPYFPIAPIRVNAEMVGENHSEQFYRDIAPEVDDILQYVGIDLETIQTALEDNPDVKDIDGAYVTFGVPLGSEHGGAIARMEKSIPTAKYVYMYLDYLFNEVQTVNKDAFEDSLWQSSGPPRYNVINIKDSDLSTQLHWNYIIKEEIPYKTYPDNDTSYLDDKRRVKGAYQLGGSLTKDSRDPKDEDFYSESSLYAYFFDDVNKRAYKYIMHGLYIYQDVYPKKGVVNTLWDSFISNAEEPKDGLYLPVSWDILQKMSNKEQQEVCFESLIMVSYAIKKTKVKWYQRGAFLNLIRIAIFVVAVYTQSYQLLSLELGASEIAYIIIESVIITLATQAALSVVFKALIDIIGVEAAFILAVVAVVAAGADMSGIIDLAASMPTAATLLEMVSAMSNAVTVSIQEDLQNIQQQLETLRSEAEALQEEIDQAKELLGDLGVDVDWIVQKMMKVEYPDQFFQRTLDTAIGYTSLDTVDYFYDNALELRLPGILS